MYSKRWEETKWNREKKFSLHIWMKSVSITTEPKTLCAALNHRQNKHVRHLTVKQLLRPPLSPQNLSLFEPGIEEGSGGTDAYWALPSSLSPPPPSLLSFLHSCSSPSISLATQESTTIIHPTSNSTVPCKSIYIHIYYPYQIHTEVSLHLPFAEPLGLS